MKFAPPLHPEADRKRFLSSLLSHDAIITGVIPCTDCERFVVNVTIFCICVESDIN